VLFDLFRQHSCSNPANLAHVNQVGSFTADLTNKATDQSPTGNIYASNSIKKTGNYWILDSGATDHVCTSLSAFNTYKSITPVQISLPNGQNIFSKISGTIVFNLKFYLTDVLYIPQFAFNLISTSKLCSTLNCNLIFSSINCVIQDTQTKERIDLVDARAGLYVFEHSTFRNTVAPHIVSALHCTVKDIHLWHHRMRHVSNERLMVLSTKYPYISAKKLDVCDTCHLAKQKKLSFTLSNSYSSKSFELIHMDIWGPCSVISMQGFQYFF